LIPRSLSFDGYVAIYHDQAMIPAKLLGRDRGVNLTLGLGRILGRLPERNDGVVCLSETEVAGMTDRTLVATGHSTLIFSARVAALAGRFLAVGRFA